MWKKLDAKVDFTFKKELYQRVKSLGFSCVSELVSYYYNKAGYSCNEIGQLLERNKFTILRWLYVWDIPRKSRGGANNPWNYSDRCLVCGIVTKSNYRARGLCKPHYQAYLRKRRKRNAACSY